MLTRDGMQSLAREIVRASCLRRSEITQRKGDVRTGLKALAEGRLREAQAAKRELARGAAKRKSGMAASLNELATARAAMEKKLDAELAQVHLALAQSQLVLVEREKRRQGEARNFQRELSKAATQGKIAVRTQLGELDRNHKAMSSQLRGSLAKGLAEHKSTVNAQMNALAEMQAGARDEWQKLTITMHGNREMPLLQSRPSWTVAPPAAEAAALPQAVGPIAGAEGAAANSETAALRERVFEYLANHPDGTRLVELEEEFGLARIQIARVVRSLLDENKAEKRDFLYFAT